MVNYNFSLFIIIIKINLNYYLIINYNQFIYYYYYYLIINYNQFIYYFLLTYFNNLLYSQLKD